MREPVSLSWVHSLALLPNDASVRASALSSQQATSENARSWMGTRTETRGEESGRERRAGKAEAGRVSSPDLDGRGWLAVGRITRLRLDSTRAALRSSSSSSSLSSSSPSCSLSPPFLFYLSLLLVLSFTLSDDCSILQRRLSILPLHSPGSRYPSRPHPRPLK
ncbi:hypothetical protein NUW54_g12622 [Trametes sanguinea]|uniref:Uncharacterized protein n=1 Tax=Trametes sanguinea TaxID=158606 RepID=A0ACC1MXK4_9APHY|nr:hypothetical protein NUW54_g12622 [Trametes sanguinea]